MRTQRKAYHLEKYIHRNEPIDSNRGSVWDASKSAYGTTISASRFALEGSKNGSWWNRAKYGRPS